MGTYRDPGSCCWSFCGDTQSIILWDILSEGEMLRGWELPNCADAETKRKIRWLTFQGIIMLAFYLYQYWNTCMILIGKIKARGPSSVEKAFYIFLFLKLDVCVCSDPVLHQVSLLKIGILTNSLSFSADVLSAPQLHPTCFHAVQHCSCLKRS